MLYNSVRTTVYFDFRWGWRVVIFSLILTTFAAQALQKYSFAVRRLKNLLLNGLAPLR